MRNQVWRIAFGICSVVGMITPVMAQAISIRNASFEDPTVDTGIFTSGGITGWSVDGAQSGIWRPAANSFFSVPVPDGSQIGYTNGTNVGQTLTSTLQTGTYQLTIRVGRRNDANSGDVTGQLWAGGTVTNGAVVGGTLLTSATFLVSSIGAGTFGTLSSAYTAGAGDPNLGQTLSITIIKENNLQADFDNVVLTRTGGSVAAPEPASGFLAMLGGGLWMAGRRRR